MRSLLYLFILLLIAWAIRELLFGSSRRIFPSSHPENGNGQEMVKDPHCGVYLPRSEAVVKKISGETRHFCSQECSDNFSGRE